MTTVSPAPTTTPSAQGGSSSGPARAVVGLPSLCATTPAPHGPSAGRR